jgi:hypothetical protein
LSLIFSSFQFWKVGGLDLFEKHTELKEQSKKTKELERELGIVEESLKKEEATNSRLEGQVKAFVEKRKQEESILWLKRKQAVLVNEWILFCVFINKYYFFCYL